jgi:large subunit ribosomal protein L4
MVSIPVYNRSGATVGSYDIDLDAIAPRINKQLLHDAVVMYQANLRQGSHRTKSRAEVAGTTKKMYRQKGTGNARAGSRRSGVRRGGGHIFARRERDYSYRMPRKALHLALRMALVSKLKSEQVLVIDELTFAAPKTSDMAGIIKALKLDGSRLLVTTEAYDANVYKSARNIERVAVAPATELNAFQVLSAGRLLVTKGALDRLRERATAKKNGDSDESTPAGRLTGSRAAAKSAGPKK